MSAGQERGIAMRKYEYAALALAALTLAVAFAIASGGSASGKLQWAPSSGIYLSGIHRRMAILPDDDFPPH